MDRRVPVSAVGMTHTLKPQPQLRSSPSAVPGLRHLEQRTSYGTPQLRWPERGGVPRMTHPVNPADGYAREFHAEDVRPAVRGAHTVGSGTAVRRSTYLRAAYRDCILVGHGWQFWVAQAGRTTAPCARRNFLVGNGCTFVGRMASWCPHDGVGYNVSLAETGAMSNRPGTSSPGSWRAPSRAIGRRRRRG